MKKTLSVLLITALVSGATAITASADDISADVFVTIADDEGKLVVTNETVTVTDLDGDGTLTIDEALYAAHEAEFDGGAESGYASSDSTYGTKLDKLWGVENGGSYGYCKNNASAMNLDETVESGDYIYAYAYTDLTAWSDTYSYFNVNSAEITAGEEITLTLSANGYDESYNPVTYPVVGAVITIDGEESGYTTAEDGTVTVPVNEAGTFVISAVSDSITLVPPVCVLSASENQSDSNEDNDTDDTDNSEEAESPDTGIEDVAAVAGLAVVAFGVIALTRKSDEK